jgi:hypothetical protein
MGRDRRNVTELRSGPSSTPRRQVPSGYHIIARAKEAIELLIDQGGFVPDTKQQFALRMGWTIPGHGSIDKPNTRLVEDICNFTRDQAHHPGASEFLGGFVIAYAPTLGGISLVDPTGEIPLSHIVHQLAGDMHQQKSIKTINRRRLPMWHAAGESAMANDDRELARLFHQAEHDIKSTGFVSDVVLGDLFKALSARSLLEIAS